MKSKIDSFETACAFMGYPVAVPNVEGLPAHLGLPNIADYQMSVINEALTKEALEQSKEVFPDYTKASQWKYYPWWKVLADKETPSGSGLSYDGCDDGNAGTDVGSRFCLPNVSLVEYSAEQFKAIHTMRMVGK